MGIKGKTTIELTDVNTGEVERYTDTNMVTNGIRNFLNSYGIWGNVMFNSEGLKRKDYTKELLGGLFLFDTTLDENVDNTVPPHTATMIGNGAVDVSNNGEVTELGSYNATESGWQEDGSLRFVYDFSTAQANGSIACACLTSRIGGYAGWGNQSRKYLYSAGDTTHNLIYYQEMYNNYKSDFVNDAYGNIIYASYNEDAIYNVSPHSIIESTNALYKPLFWATSKKIRIEKRYAGFKSLNLSKGAYNFKILEYWDLDIPSEILTYMGTSKNYVYAKGDPISKNAFIIFGKTTSISAGSFFYLMKIDKDRNVSTYKVYNNSSVTLYIYPNIVFFDGEYIYMTSTSSSDEYAFYKIKYSNSAEITKTSLKVSMGFGYNSSVYHISCFGDKTFAISHINASISIAHCHSIYNSETDKYLYTNGAIRNEAAYYIPISDIKGVYLTNGGKYVVPEARYLATINNLAQPVVKTANKTMKVTYTVTFDEE